MSDECFRLNLGEQTAVDEVVLGFRKNGTFYELLTVSPPIEAELRWPSNDTAQSDE
ncbi:hypothetical protein NKF06_15025 [Haloferax sp. AB510]|uniref:hypothetical protein n=1 Tax=Haloferax sp. AB510 TaxID=2934172 RepID=UPI00209C5195|nr:hypothetical protein [Haloferax sp. AB510]MCO8267863.1 hypothetical protein [Haloferax sp. AB510]